MGRLRSLLTRVALAGVAVTACAEQPTAPEADVAGPAMVAVPGVSVPVLTSLTARPHALSMTRTIGPAGGEISLGGVSLTVPAGALDEATEITMSIPAGRYVQVLFAPHGLEFKEPATVSMNLGGTVAAINADILNSLQGAYFEDDADAADGEVTVAETLGVSVRGGRAVFEITHFSGYCVTSTRCGC